MWPKFLSYSWWMSSESSLYQKIVATIDAVNALPQEVVDNPFTPRIEKQFMYQHPLRYLYQMYLDAFYRAELASKHKNSEEEKRYLELAKKYEKDISTRLQKLQELISEVRKSDTPKDFFVRLNENDPSTWKNLYEILEVLWSNAANERYAFNSTHLRTPSTNYSHYKDRQKFITDRLNDSKSEKLPPISPFAEAARELAGLFERGDKAVQLRQRVGEPYQALDFFNFDINVLAEQEEKLLKRVKKALDLKTALRSKLTPLELSFIRTMDDAQKTKHFDRSRLLGSVGLQQHDLSGLLSVGTPPLHRPSPNLDDLECWDYINDIRDCMTNEEKRQLLKIMTLHQRIEANPGLEVTFRNELQASSHSDLQRFEGQELGNPNWRSFLQSLTWNPTITELSVWGPIQQIWRLLDGNQQENLHKLILLRQLEIQLEDKTQLIKQAKKAFENAKLYFGIMHAEMGCYQGLFEYYAYEKLSERIRNSEEAFTTYLRGVSVDQFSELAKFFNAFQTQAQQAQVQVPAWVSRAKGRLCQWLEVYINDKNTKLQHLQAEQQDLLRVGLALTPEEQARLASLTLEIPKYQQEIQLASQGLQLTSGGGKVPELLAFIKKAYQDIEGLPQQPPQTVAAPTQFNSLVEIRQKLKSWIATIKGTPYQRTEALSLDGQEALTSLLANQDCMLLGELSKDYLKKADILDKAMNGGRRVQDFDQDIKKAAELIRATNIAGLQKKLLDEWYGHDCEVVMGFRETLRTIFGELKSQVSQHLTLGPKENTMGPHHQELLEITSQVQNLIARIERKEQEPAPKPIRWLLPRRVSVGLDADTGRDRSLFTCLYNLYKLTQGLFCKLDGLNASIVTSIPGRLTLLGARIVTFDRKEFEKDLARFNYLVAKVFLIVLSDPSRLDGVFVAFMKPLAQEVGKIMKALEKLQPAGEATVGKREMATAMQGFLDLVSYALQMYYGDNLEQSVLKEKAVAMGIASDKGFFFTFISENISTLLVFGAIAGLQHWVVSPNWIFETVCSSALSTTDCSELNDRLHIQEGVNAGCLVLLAFLFLRIQKKQFDEIRQLRALTDPRLAVWMIRQQSWDEMQDRIDRLIHEGPKVGAEKLLSLPKAVVAPWPEAPSVPVAGRAAQYRVGYQQIP
ncbi:MAG: hypothetical protein K0S08_200 [Gammaproteobacteria bacterium]|jgi:hypothetical protein|nr:hypothetical protein [Gammaproteobacteria bacterium]